LNIFGLVIGMSCPVFELVAPAKVSIRCVRKPARQLPPNILLGASALNGPGEVAPFRQIGSTRLWSPSCPKDLNEPTSHQKPLENSRIQIPPHHPPRRNRRFYSRRMNRVRIFLSASDPTSPVSAVPGVPQSTVATPNFN
jgi:hypothetical protein